MIVEKKLTTAGDCLAVTIPKKAAVKLEWSKGDMIKIIVLKSSIMVEKV